jgi:CheY-like chemotaxis protein
VQKYNQFGMLENGTLGMKNTFLIVDDAPLYQDVLKSIVEKFGYAAVTVAKPFAIWAAITHPSWAYF